MRRSLAQGQAPPAPRSDPLTADSGVPFAARPSWRDAPLSFGSSDSECRRASRQYFAAIFEQRHQSDHLDLPPRCDEPGVLTAVLQEDVLRDGPFTDDQAMPLGGSVGRVCKSELSSRRASTRPLSSQSTAEVVSPCQPPSGDGDAPGLYHTTHVLPSARSVSAADGAPLSPPAEDAIAL